MDLMEAIESFKISLKLPDDNLDRHAYLKA